MEPVGKSGVLENQNCKTSTVLGGEGKQCRKGLSTLRKECFVIKLVFTSL